MDFRHLIKTADKMARIVAAKSKKSQFSRDEISGFAIQHFYQLYDRSEDFKKKAEDLGFVESAVYNGCLRAVEKSRVFSSLDALEFWGADIWDFIYSDIQSNADSDDSDGFDDNDDDHEYALEAEQIDRAKALCESFDANFSSIIRTVSSPVAKVILTEIFSPSLEMRRWIEAEEYRVRSSLGHAKLNYRAFEAIYGVSQIEYHTAIRHIRQKIEKLQNVIKIGS